MTYYVLTASSWIQDAIEGFSDWRRESKLRRQQRAAYKTTVRELSMLTDFELNDIGICRGDIRNVAKGDSTLKRSSKDITASSNDNLRGWV
jgi:uncharacterized protein YjiS (DUF1127 family)